MTTRRSVKWIRVAVLLALSALALCATALHAAARAQGAPLLPNLVADPPDTQSIATDTSTGKARLLLRFNGYIHNKGPGAVDFRGAREAPKVSAKTLEEAERAGAKEEGLPQKVEEELAAPPMNALQRLFTTSAEETNRERAHVDEPSSAELIYSSGDGHHHWHLQKVAKYSLWNSAKTAEVAPAMKVGFCLDDSQHVESSIGPASAVYTDATGRDFCMKYQPYATSLFEGISPGWRDIYDSSLAFQWVDVSNVLPGEYWLREDVNPLGVVKETGGENVPSYSSSATVISGFDALPQTLAVPGNTASAVTLTSKAFKDTSKPTYTIVSGPSHGALGTISEGHVTYTPTAGYSGADSFTFSARDAGSAFPEHPAVATVSLEVGESTAPSVSIEGAPVSMQAVSAVQLSAHVVNDLPEVTWSASAGSITSAGKYTAPVEVPAGGSVTVTATTSKGAKASKSIEITPAAGSQGLLVGDGTATYSVGDQTGAGREESFQFTAKSSGTVEELLFRTNGTANTGVTALVLAVFAENGGKPGEVLGRGTASGTPATSSWIKVTGLSVAGTAGTKYWLVALPVGSGFVHYNVASALNVGTGNLESVARGLAGATAESSWEAYNQGPVGFQANGSLSGAAATATIARVRSALAVASSASRHRAVRRPHRTIRKSVRHRLGRIAVAGAPATMIAGTSVQLSALEAGAQGPVQWSSSAGTIRPGGLFTAPLGARARTVSIHARARGARGESLRVLVAPRPDEPAAPAAAAPAAGGSATGLTALQAMLFNSEVVLTTRAQAAGMVTIVARAEGKLLGSCSTPTPGGVTVTCRLSMAGPPRGALLDASATLLVGHRVLARQTVSGAAVPAMKMASMLPATSGSSHSALAYFCSPALRRGGPGAIS
jgi:hypothetical protein